MTRLKGSPLREQREALGVVSSIHNNDSNVEGTNVFPVGNVCAAAKLFLPEDGDDVSFREEGGGGLKRVERDRYFCWGKSSLTLGARCAGDGGPEWSWEWACGGEL